MKRVNMRNNVCKERPDLCIWFDFVNIVVWMCGKTLINGQAFGAFKSVSDSRINFVISIK
jgi:hypothetical protein